MTGGRFFVTSSSARRKLATNGDELGLAAAKAVGSVPTSALRCSVIGAPGCGIVADAQGMP